MSKTLYFRNKYYKWLPIRFLVERVVKNMVNGTVDFLEDFIEEKEQIIDIGGGGGWISQELQKRKKTKNLILDVINLNQTDLRLVIYDGKNIPFDDNTFDTALLICVLHHCQDSLRVLEEAKRVVKNRIIIIEDISTSRFGGIALRFKDAITNICFCLLANSLKEITNLPFDFKTVPEWEKIFQDLNLKVIHKREFRPPMGHHSVAFVVQKN
jgi:ubiquinone/menaquinone biosynthesis C-methylase UbiE